MHALILAAGRGKRLENLTAECNKCMISHQGLPILEHVIARMAALRQIDQIVVVVGYRAEDVINHFGNHYGGKPVRYCIQRDQRGLVHAMDCAREVLAGQEFILLLGDEVMDAPRYEEFLDDFETRGWHALLGSSAVANRELIKKNYTFLPDDHRRVFRLIEKPAIPVNDLLGTGSVVFRADVFDFVDATPVNAARGEKELPELLQTIVDTGRPVGYFDLCRNYGNVNSVEDLEQLRERSRVGQPGISVAAGTPGLRLPAGARL
jgi:UDP-N-acetylglucosamine diphosphorylase / glucose-1-phosphate thymidylyltransferase / UDP-N-acetylgalactosamine diphosphorylase / glucosamine-1-phosphate N-acetyltransferase / galactosamine-1-phosphate N-acetyltransferase